MLGIAIIAISFIFVVCYLIINAVNDVKSSRERREHEQYLANPYRVIKNGLNQYCIQNYTFVTKEGEQGKWIWQNLPTTYKTEREVKNAYCELMAQFKFKSIHDSQIESQKMENSEKYLKSIFVHEIVDMSSETEKCQQILDKMLAEKAEAEATKKPTRGHKKAETSN
jgi:hypothetical protein